MRQGVFDRGERPGEVDVEGTTEPVGLEFVDSPVDDDADVVVEHGRTAEAVGAVRERRGQGVFVADIGDDRGQLGVEFDLGVEINPAEVAPPSRDRAVRVALGGRLGEGPRRFVKRTWVAVDEADLRTLTKERGRCSETVVHLPVRGTAADRHDRRADQPTRRH